MLHVVVQGTVDELDLAERERNQPDPVVVEVRELRGRERQHRVQQLAPKQRGRAGDRVCDQQREEV